LVAHGSNFGVKDHFEIYHVIGDPTLQLLADEPLSIHLRASVLRDILYINTSTCPRGSVLTIWHMNKLLNKDKTLLHEGNHSPEGSQAAHAARASACADAPYPLCLLLSTGVPLRPGKLKVLTKARPVHSFAGTGNEPANQ